MRKTVTVLFCDVVGSTQLGERFDPEILRDVMARFYAAIREPVERHGGTVEKVIGDALVAVFGIPAVHEDDALRAVRAALEMRDAVAAMGEIEARIGVNTGDVLATGATQGESLVVGDAVNIAARLEQAAAPGTVLVGEATWALVAHAAHGHQVEPLTAKGKSEPLAAWLLESVDLLAPGHRRRLDLPMVGRATELGLVRLTADRTAQLRRPHLVTMLGQPGIGKSRLASELQHAEEATTLAGHCRATASASPLEPLVEAARAAIPDGRFTEQAVAALMPGDSEATSVTACLADADNAGTVDLSWAASRLVGAIADAGLVVILFEDVHWAEDALLDAIEQLADRRRRRSLLVVCTARPEFVDRRPGWGAGANTLSFALERLDDAETRHLLVGASPGLPADQADRVVAAAEGNPLFAEHLAALIADHDPSVGLPRSIQVLLSARLEALPEPEREVVSVAAVAGREFPVAAVEALTGRAVQAELGRLAQHELVVRTGRHGRRQFSHTLLQEAAYGLIPKQRRAELHTQMAGWLDEQHASDAAVGDHLERAYRLRAELGLADEATAAIREQAGTRLATAGRRADAMGEPVRASLLLERALELLPDRSPVQAAAMVELAAAGWNLLPRSERRRLLDDGADRAAQLGLRALELRARVLRLGASDGTLRPPPGARRDQRRAPRTGDARRSARPGRSPLHPSGERAQPGPRRRRAGVDAPRAGRASQLGRRCRLGARDPGRHADRLTGAGAGGRGRPERADGRVRAATDLPVRAVTRAGCARPAGRRRRPGVASARHRPRPRPRPGAPHRAVSERHRDRDAAARGTVRGAPRHTPAVHRRAGTVRIVPRRPWHAARWWCWRCGWGT